MNDELLERFLSQQIRDKKEIARLQTRLAKANKEKREIRSACTLELSMLTDDLEQARRWAREYHGRIDKLEKLLKPLDAAVEVETWPDETQLEGK